jgi:hypothetical protein
VREIEARVEHADQHALAAVAQEVGLRDAEHLDLAIGGFRLRLVGGGEVRGVPRSVRDRQHLAHEGERADPLDHRRRRVHAHGVQPSRPRPLRRAEALDGRDIARARIDVARCSGHGAGRRFPTFSRRTLAARQGSRREIDRVSGGGPRRSRVRGRERTPSTAARTVGAALGAASDGPPRSSAPSVRTARIRLTVATPTRPDLDCRRALVTMGLCLSRKTGDDRCERERSCSYQLCSPSY